MPFIFGEHHSFGLKTKYTFSGRWILHFLSRKPKLLRLSPHVLCHGAAVSFVLHSMHSWPDIKRACVLPDLPH